MKRSLPSIITGTILVIVLGLYMITYIVRYNECAIVRTFGKIDPPGLLFSDPQAAFAELDKGELSDDLRSRFAGSGIELSEQAWLEPKYKGLEWRIIDGDEIYAARKTGEQLKVFDPDKRGSNSVITQAGLYWKWPWPIQKVDRYDNRVQITSTPGEESPTNDGKNVILTTTIGWRIYDPYLFTIRCQNMQDAEEKLKTRVRNDQKTVIGQYDFSNFVSTDPEELKYDTIEKEILGTVRPAARELYGIEVVSVGIEKLALPERITKTVFEAMKKERQAVAARYTSEGQSGAQKIKDEAEAIAGTIMSFAERKAAEIVAEGQRRAAEYNRILRKDEELAQFLLKIRYLPEILAKRSTVFFEHEPPFDILMEKGKTPARVESPTTQPAEGMKAERDMENETAAVPTPDMLEVK